MRYIGLGGPAELKYIVERGLQHSDHNHVGHVIQPLHLEIPSQLFQ